MDTPPLDKPLSRLASPLEVVARLVQHSGRWLFESKPLLLELVMPVVHKRGKSKGRILLGYGITWLAMLHRMMWFVIALIPAWIQLVSYYIRSPSLLRGVRYGPYARNTMDIFLPELAPSDAGADGGSDASRGAPVLVFFTGGAWIIGYKAWGALMGRSLRQHGVLVVCPDYRNFPGGTVGDMLEDVDAAMQWVFDNIAEYGGDPTRIVLSGQSAGAHLSALSLLSRCQIGTAQPPGRGAGSGEAQPTSTRRLSLGEFVMADDPDLFDDSGEGWQVQQLAACVLISGPFDLVTFAPHMHTRGLSTAVMHAIFNVPLGTDDADAGHGSQPPRVRPRMETEEAVSHMPDSSLLTASGRTEAARRLRACSPSLLLESLAVGETTDEARPLQPDRSWVAQLPPITLLHGTADKTCPHAQSEKLCAALLGAGVRTDRVTLKLYPGKTHTSPIIEDPISGAWVARHA